MYPMYPMYIVNFHIIEINMRKTLVIFENVC